MSVLDCRAVSNSNYTFFYRRFQKIFLNICINWALSDLGHNEQKIIIINIHPSISLVKISISVHPCDLPV